jgi:DNA-binding transcriptional LysR family regulator
MIAAQIDFDVLRSFVTVCRFGSINGAAQTLHRRQSTLSMQMRRLEDLLQQQLWHRHGRGVSLTAAGEVFFTYARRMLALGDELEGRLSEKVFSGPLRIGMPEEVMLSHLPAALIRFRQRHPDIELEILVDSSAFLSEQWLAERLDIAVCVPSTMDSEPLDVWEIALQWVASDSLDLSRDQPLPIIAFAEPCVWRGHMLSMLRETGRSWRIVLTSASVATVQAGVNTGLGIALLAANCIQPTMRILTSRDGVPAPMTAQYGIYIRDAANSLVAAATEAVLAAIHGVGLPTQSEATNVQFPARLRPAAIDAQGGRSGDAPTQKRTVR